MAIDNTKYINIFNKEVVPALGCTEPIATALAAATSARNLGKEVEKIELFLSGNIIKNGMGVGIPGTGMVGLKIAAALGVTGGNSEKLLEVLNGVSSVDIELAKKMVIEEKVSITKKDNVDKLYIEAKCTNGENYARTLICGAHTNVVLEDVDGKVISQKSCNAFSEKEESEITDIVEHKMTVEGIWEFVNNVPLDEISYVLKGAELNRTIGLEGLIGDYGLQVGKTLRQNIVKGFISDDMSNWAMTLTAAAADARMAGSILPVMSNSGSGNQGITVMLPILAACERLHCSKEKLVRALYLGNLIAIHLKEYMSKLSALCGVVTAATGASCGITYLLGGNLQQIGYSIKSMIGNISGMICDGAKAGCSLKVSTAVSAALQSAFLAIENIEISEFDGIIEKDIEKTIQNLAQVVSEGMEETDKVILDIMSCK